VQKVSKYIHPLFFSSFLIDWPSFTWIGLWLPWLMRMSMMRLEPVTVLMPVLLVYLH
jgi:hypothetical protein